jgi:hypothetical protein
MKYQVGRVAAAPNHQADSSGGTDRMETELIGWLTGLEPTGAPIALRLRTFADLREEAARPRPRLPWLMPAVSSIGSLGAVVIGASLIMLIAVVGATVDHVHAVAGAMAPLAGSGSVPQTPGDFTDSGYSPDPVTLSILFAATALAAWGALQTRVHQFVARVTYGKDEAPAGEPFPFKRQLRHVPRAALATGAIGALVVAWEFWVLLTYQGDELMPSNWTVFFQWLGLITFIPYCSIVALRYRLGDRSSRWLLTATTVTALTDLLLAALVTVNWMGIYSPWLNDLTELNSSLLAVSTVALAAGLASRHGGIPRPPTWIASTVAGGFFLLVAAGYFIVGMWPHTADGWITDATGIASSWLGTLSWAAITWIGVCAWRQRNSWGWRLLLFVGIVALLDRVPGYVLGIYSSISIVSLPQASGSLLETIRMQYFWWKSMGMVLEMFGVLVVLVSGLRIVRPGETPSEAAAVEAEPMAGIAPAAGTAPAAGNGEGLAPQPEFPPVTSPGGTK